MCYIGSTTKDYLSKRMVQHRAMYNLWKRKPSATNYVVFSIFEKYGIENCRIVLVELCPCDTKDELFKREAYYITSTECVNKKIPGRTTADYYQAHKEEIHEHRQLNKEARSNYDKIYYQNNKEKKNARDLAVKTCICGTKHAHGKTAMHLRTATHQNYIANQEIDI